MGYGCRHNNSVTIELLDLNGVRNVAATRRDNATSDYQRAFYDGMCAFIEICTAHTWRDQSDYYTILDGVYQGRDEQWC